MCVADWETRALRSRIEVQSPTLESLAHKLENEEDFPTDTPPKLCRIIRTTASEINKHLSLTPDDQLSFIANILHIIVQHLRYVERSKTIQTPWSMIQATESFLKAQTGKNYHFIIRPQWSHNYGVVGDFVQYYRNVVKTCCWIPLNEWEAEAGCDGDSKIYCVSFPRLERMNCLLHALWGHEVGHVLASIWLEANFDRVWTQESGDVRAAIGAASQPLSSFVDPLFQSQYLTEIVASKFEQARTVARQGLEELLCDAVGIHLLGPAALAAFIEYSVGLGMDESPLEFDYYPPWRYRLRLMSDACHKDLNDDTEHSYSGTVLVPLIAWLRNVRQLTADVTDKDMLQQDKVTSEAYRVVEKYWDQARTAVLNDLPDHSKQPYLLSMRSDTVQKLVERLQNKIPPNEVGHNRPASLEDILNAGWAYKAIMLKQGEWTNIDEWETTLRLLLKGIETGFVQQRFAKKITEAT